MIFKYYNSNPHEPRPILHFTLKVDQKYIFYSYIRKNASSTFKALFAGENNYQIEENRNVLHYMCKNNLYKDEDESKLTHRLFVFRDPIERIFSLFKNKFIECESNEDISTNLSAALGKNFSEVSFFEFCMNYLPMRNEFKIDPHTLPMQWSLKEGVYDTVVDMKNLQIESKNIFGEDIAKKYFIEKVNTTDVNRHEDIPNAVNLKSALLREILKKEGIYPSLDSLVTPIVKENLYKLYECDFKMISQFEISK